ncbi:MAG: VOC family protein [Thermoplasmata archaeon]|nr:VOC family protein [Thermoplasmata archaeon]
MKLTPKTVAVVVSNRQRAKRWYTQKLGLKVLTEDEHWTVVGRRHGGFAIHLCQVSEYDPKGKLEPGNTGILFQVDTSMPKAYAALKKRGVKFPNPPEKMEWGWYCIFADPDGNEFSLSPSG